MLDKISGRFRSKALPLRKMVNKAFKQFGLKAVKNCAKI
jgi:hypothetical protein